MARRTFTLFADTARLHLFDPVIEHPICPAARRTALLAAERL
jgi:hypothetical protein